MEPDADTIAHYLDQYGETQGVLPGELQEYGDIYRSRGYLTRDQLYDIAYASSTRAAHHVRDNPADRCETVTRAVRTLDDDFCQVALLCALAGFKAPTASCVLTALDPDSHAVVDTRVWASLDRFGHLDGRKESFGPADYVTMVRPIRRIADETGYTPAEVGYALFAHDADVREGTLH